ncbi:MAG: helix-turn-helix domain-containing protein [Ignavibacteriaceae bacterium]|jgi:transcriptional regulator with XRE-family HTH domain|nr:helix-turn-helix domain-containing protein [Ignavibacteriaceae bacterium]MCW8812081.1 helix-turn-helix domain-containing protein [Chlorobium sp.]MCW8822903.1 helix-turn-helix domain-containing protein [Ignavibacteriaceae bacterium]MCW8960832.1 helix-turn-helix domain-containing protein [Ignavibacteriaceae bacterium]MCW9097751.1 helix-turn-helix domain-containing protein [Ignavibacteriaceae bacterium]
MLTKFADELRSTRLEKGISLEQMAAKTRIDIKFLEAIDNGNFGFLPELYIKAFIKQYAKVLDLDEQETLNRYEEAKAGKLIEKDDSKSLLEKKIEIEKPVPEPKSEETVKIFNDNDAKKMNVNPQDKKKMFRLLTYVSGIVVVAIIIFIAFFNKSSNIIVEEKPYDKVLEETKGRYIVPEKKDESLNTNINLDSLILQIANVDSLDSAWVMVIYDDKSKEDFLLYPKRAKTISAFDNFKLTLGNSGVISLILNNHKLNFDGRRGAVRHYMVSKDTIERLTSPPILHTN